MINERHNRLEAAIRCSHADRVPFCVNVNDYYCNGYGVTIYDAMKDARFLKEPVLRFAKELNPDWVSLPITYPVDALELMNSTNMRYPGPAQNLPVDTPYQYIDACYLEEEDYGAYLSDPSDYVFRNVFAKTYPAFAPLTAINATGLVNSVYALAVFSAPPVKEALQKLMETGDIVGKYLGQIGEIGAALEMAGYPTFGSAALLNPFDAFADGVRGIMEAAMDTLTNPDELTAALKHWGNLCIPSAIAQANMAHTKYVFMPLHIGGEMFMSLDNYKEFYWPHLKRCLLAVINAGFTPIVFCEGSYTSRLELLADIPEGKVVYLFEDVDLVKAKKILGKKACIMGGMQTQTLMFGTKEDVVEETKRVLDICAPDGGFIMSNTLALDTAKRENLEIWRETVDKYGKY